MGFYNPEFDEKRRVEQKPYTKYQIGKSREQGVRGATQGSQGWMAQYGAGDYAERLGAQANALLNSITQKNGAPSLQPITHSLLSQEGFNQALRNVQIHNLQKIAEQRRRALTNALGSVLRSGTALRTAGMNNATRERTAALDAATRKYGMDKNYDIRAKGLSEEQRYHDALIDYNKGLLDTQKGRLQLEAWKAKQPKAKKADQLDLVLKRQRLVKDPETFLKGVYGEDIYGEMDGAQKAEAIKNFVATGTLPAYKFKSDWINDTINKEDGYIDPYGLTSGGQSLQQAVNGQKAQKPAPKITKDHILSIRSEIAKDFGVPEEQIAFDPERKIYALPNGYDVPLNKAYERVFGGR